MSQKNKKKSISGGRKREILSKATQIFASQGFSKTNVSDITDAVGVTEGALYKHFSSKEKLLFEVASPFFVLLLKESLEHLQGIEGAENKLRKFLFHLLNFFEKHAEFTKIYFLELRSNSRFYLSDIYKTLHAYRQILFQILEEGKKEETFRSEVDQEAFLDLSFGAVEHTVMGRLLLQKPLTITQRFHSIFDLVHHSVIKPTSSLPPNGDPREKDKSIDILKAATRVFAQKGFSDAKISEIALAAGIGDATIYNYFKSKEDLLFSIPEHGLSFLISDFNKRLEDLTRAGNKLRILTDHVFEFYHQNPEYVTILLLELRSNLKYPQNKAYQFLKSYSQIPMEIVRQGKAEGIFRQEVDERAYRDMFFGAIENMILRWRLFNSPRNLLVEKGKLFDLLFQALKKKQV